MKKNNTISLIDGSGFIFRAYYALPSLTNRQGVPVGAVLGFCNMLFKLIEEKQSNKLIVIFDTSRKTFRSDIYVVSLLRQETRQFLVQILAFSDQPSQKKDSR